MPSAYIPRLAEETKRSVADLCHVEPEQMESLAMRYGTVLNERMRVVTAMRTAVVTQNEVAYREAEKELQAVREEMESCSLELGNVCRTTPV